VKKTLTLVLLLTPFLSPAQKTDFSIQIVFHTIVPSKYIYVSQSYEGKVDTLTYPANDTLLYKGTISKPGIFQLRKDLIGAFQLWVDDTPITCDVVEEKGNRSNKLNITNLKGSADTKLLNEMTVPSTFSVIIPPPFSESSRDSVTRLIKEYETNTSYVRIDSLLKARPESPIIPFYITYYAPILHADTILSLYNRLPENTRNTEKGKDVLEYLERLTLFKKGKVIDNFKMRDPKGKKRSLYSISAKYILLDFWASWCGPCRAENPTLVKLYKQFHDKGFEIVSISLDDSKADWIKAIKKDGLNWYHLSDLKRWECALVEQYKIRGIPYSVVLDENYKVIAIPYTARDIERLLISLLKL